jgi:hypothetical protein
MLLCSKSIREGARRGQASLATEVAARGCAARSACADSPNPDTPGGTRKRLRLHGWGTRVGGFGGRRPLGAILIACAAGWRKVFAGRANMIK